MGDCYRRGIHILVDIPVLLHLSVFHHQERCFVRLLSFHRV